MPLTLGVKIAIFLNYLCCIFGIVLSSSRSWRVWQFEDGKVITMFIGLWDAFYVEKPRTHDLNMSVAIVKRVNGSWAIPSQLCFAQDSMSLADCLTFISAVFATITIIVTWTTVFFPGYLCMCYRICVGCLLNSAACTGSTVIMNFMTDFFGTTTLKFPIDFPVQSSMFIKKHFTYLVPLGLFNSSLSIMSSALFFHELWLMNTVIWYEAE